MTKKLVKDSTAEMTKNQKERDAEQVTYTRKVHDHDDALDAIQECQ